MKITLANYGAIISTDEKSKEIYELLKKSIDKGDVVIVDAKGVTISTKSSRYIFGRLYRELKEMFNDKIQFINNSSLFTFSVNEGISTEMTH